jgi:hypothetical protein
VRAPQIMAPSGPSRTVLSTTVATGTCGYWKPANCWSKVSVL